MRTTGYNSTYKKLAVQWLNKALCFVSSFVVADSFVLRNRQLLVAANVIAQCKKPTAQMAHLVFADTRANAQKTKRAIFCQRTDRRQDIKK